MSPVGATESKYFNPRSPHGERPRPSVPHISTIEFQSTLPARGATAPVRAAHQHNRISIHAPRTGSDTQTMGNALNGSSISIHAPRTGSDRIAAGQNQRGRISIHAPRTGSDASSPNTRAPYTISIHAPRTGSDLAKAGFSAEQIDFNPRSPHGERLFPDQLHTYHKAFQSTLPARGATQRSVRNRRRLRISIHAPRTGSDGSTADGGGCVV